MKKIKKRSDLFMAIGIILMVIIQFYPEETSLLQFTTLLQFVFYFPYGFYINRFSLKNVMIQIFITGGTFDKSYDSINGQLYFEKTT